MKWSQLRLPTVREIFVQVLNKTIGGVRRSTIVLKNEVYWLLPKFQKRLVPKISFVNLYCHISFSIRFSKPYQRIRGLAFDQLYLVAPNLILNNAPAHQSRLRIFTLIVKYHSFKEIWITFYHTSTICRILNIILVVHIIGFLMPSYLVWLKL